MPYVTDAGSSCGMNFVNGGSAGTLDGVSIVGGHEYAETITDQFPAGGWLDSAGNENGDKCAWLSSGTGRSQNIALGTGSFAVQSTWGNDTSSCSVSHPIVTNAASDFSISASPSSLSVGQGSHGTTTVGTAVTSGSAQTVSLSASGLPAGATAAFSPASVTAGGSSTLTLSAGASTALGTYTVTVTGTGGPSHATSVSLTVTAPAPNDFSLSASPSSVGAVQGSSGTSTISTAVTSGSAQTVSLSATGLPAGATAAFSPTSVTAGGSSTLTLAAAATTPVGTYTITVTGTGSQTHSTSVSLTVTAPVTGPLVVNGGFETGSLSGWTAAGPAETVVTGGHTGTYAARLGSTSRTNGNSSVQQTVRVPTANAALSFWYQPHCRSTRDAQQMQIRSTAGAILASELNVCDGSGAWKQFSASLAAFGGQTVVLWLNNRDDNSFFSPSYVLFDDVAVTGTGAPPRGGSHPPAPHVGRLPLR
jgi:hypothetical protein